MILRSGNWTEGDQNKERKGGRNVGLADPKESQGHIEVSGTS